MMYKIRFDWLVNSNYQMKPHTFKSTQYQDYRTKAKSDLNCSGLLTGLNQLDMQMKQYQQLRKNKNSCSELDLHIKQNQHLETPQKHKHNQTLLKTDKSYTPSLATIAEQQQTRPKPAKTTTFTSSSVVFSNQKPMQSKALLNKAVNAHSKQKDGKKQKLSGLRLRTKQLQQQFLELLGTDLNKKNQINKQFSMLFKLFD